MKVEQYVMAYQAEQDRIRAILPNSFVSLRPVLRINCEITNDGKKAKVEFNTAVEKDGVRGWLNIASFDTEKGITRDNGAVTIETDLLKIRFAPTGAKGGCPAEKDNGGCYFIEKGEVTLRPNEIITVNKEFCDCEFLWKTEGDTNGKSAGRSVPLFFEECKNVYPDKEFSLQNAACIECKRVAGAYKVEFER